MSLSGGFILGRVRAWKTAPVLDHIHIYSYGRTILQHSMALGALYIYIYSYSCVHAFIMPMHRYIYIYNELCSCMSVF